VKGLQGSVAGLEATVQVQQALIVELQGSVGSVNERVAAIETSEVLQLGPFLDVGVDTDPEGLLPPFHRIRIAGMNVQIVSGGLAGRGNLVLGQNANTPNPTRRGSRTGIHNLVLGNYHEYLGEGGIVTGHLNRIEDGGVIIGGQDNLARGGTVIRGWFNQAYGGTTVIGGEFNEPSGVNAVVVGGAQGKPMGRNATVSGGYGNTAAGDYSSVSGGIGNSANGEAASVSGGEGVEAAADRSWAAGGLAWP
jgi:hypothetical protein